MKRVVLANNSRVSIQCSKEKGTLSWMRDSRKAAASKGPPRQKSDCRQTLHKSKTLSQTTRGKRREGRDAGKDPPCLGRYTTPAARKPNRRQKGGKPSAEESWRLQKVTYSKSQKTGQEHPATRCCFLF